ncbi:MAG: hypothetical protein GY756_05550 [bacterium]|nr:hypothetical protein [bacterium]
MSRNKYLCIFCLLPLLISHIFYLFFRSGTAIHSYFGSEKVFLDLDNKSINILLRMILENLPSAMCTFSLTNIFIFIWNFEINNKSIYWILSGVFSGMIWEVIQFFIPRYGTFDFNDIVFSLISGLFALLNIKKIVFA